MFGCGRFLVIQGLRDQVKFGKDKHVKISLTSTRPLAMFSTSTPHPQMEAPSLPLRSDDLLQCPSLTQKHKIPPELHAMNELDKMGLAYAYEARDVVENELRLAEKRYIQQLIVTKTYLLRLVNAKDKLRQMSHDLDTMVNKALYDISDEENPNLHVSHAGKNSFYLVSFE
jgi:hypothetical protein